MITKKTEEMIYIAGAISDGGKANGRGQYQNVKYAQKYYSELIDNGFTPFCPHLSYYPWLDHDIETGWKRWLELDLNYIDSSKALMRLPNSSKGADLEVSYAKSIGLPVIFAKSVDTCIDQLTEVLGKPKSRNIMKYVRQMKELKKNVA